MKDGNKTLTRNVDAEFWFIVKWDPVAKIGTVAGEAEAKYDSELKVENLPKVTAPAPGGGTVKFEPSVGGKLTGDNRRKFPVVGVLMVDEIRFGHIAPSQGLVAGARGRRCGRALGCTDGIYLARRSGGKRRD